MEKTRVASRLGLILAIASLLTFLALQVSCVGSKGKLTRELALEKLSAALDCPVVLVMPEGKITDHFKLDMPMPSLRAAQESSEVLKGLERESGIIKLLTSMAKGGFISFSYSRPRIVFDPKARVQPLRAVYEIEVALTKRGKEFQMAEALADFPFSLSLKYFLLSPVHEKAFSEEFAGEFDLRCLKLCEKIVTGVTGIRKAGKASATVDFEWKFDRLTALGEFISQDFAWTYNDGFFAVMSLREGTWSRVVDLLDPRISTRENARFIRDESGWRVEGGENP